MMFVLQRDRELMMFFKGAFSTYWLIHREGMARKNLGTGSRYSSGESSDEERESEGERVILSKDSFYN